MKKQYYYIVVIIFILFFTVNFINIFRKDIFVDETITYYIVNKLSLREIVRGVDVHNFYYFIMKILPHNNIYLLRFYSLIVMSMALYSLFITINKLYNTKTALTILVLSSLSMTISEYSTQARMYSLLFLFSSLMFYSFSTKQYNITLLIIIMSITTHYYAVFLLIPYITTLFLTEKRAIFYKQLKITIITVSILFLILSPIIYNQFFSENNPYKIPPPHDKPTLMSLPSMIIFPLIIPSTVTQPIMMLLSAMMIFLVLYLLFTFNMDFFKKSSQKNHKQINIFLLLSYITTFIIFFISFIGFPYHHRYTIMFFPMVYLLLTLSLNQKPMVEQRLITTLFIIFITITFLSYQLNPKDQFIKISKEIKCPSNILHETPFSFLPMSIYLPNCSHYMALSSDWTGFTNDTLYTTKDKINNRNVSYDYYIHYFDILKGMDLLGNSKNITFIKVKD